ncbi:hypothetical protein Acsp06_60230 [Actinomycetospora sp. NBRC 106375]|uniref:DUF1918 domain-containing protein n=1 Tax=Actinomycetospora sp. NBRC 106375 TaxID=3032207 RepID=UPI00249FAD3C|nr:DUF1918 domain-containing protein [Actinomycetospora sp. NBRC 106375]GLZ49838.1 hypothetical protein Acsp06_60230 [Actinomycetospora sp. NBRC 106375]
MHARVGNWLIVEGLTDESPRRQAQIVAVDHADGSPPFWVRWLGDEHTSLVFPGPDARVEEHPRHLGTP